MKTLVIAEKPSVARDIARVLKCDKKNQNYIYNENYVITWAIGHLVGLKEPNQIDEKYKKWRIEDLPILPNKIPLKVISKTSSQYKIIKQLMNSAEVDNIICATDAGREGELIFRLIYEYSKCKLPCKRLWINSLTDESIKKGFDNLKSNTYYDSLYYSAICRAYADWYIGMNASRLFSLLYNAHLSIGRVQTPTLALIVKRQLEIDNFVPQAYWKVIGTFGEIKATWFDITNNNFKINSQINNKEQADSIVERCKEKNAKVYSIKSDEKRELQPLLYDLTSLQREANEIYGYTADKTLQLAQELYEKYKLITYPRTDSRYLSNDIQKQIPLIFKKIKKLYSDQVEKAEIGFNQNINAKIFNNSKVTDHHAIIPTTNNINIDTKNKDIFNVYNLVLIRFLAVFYPIYIFKQNKLILNIDADYFLSQNKSILQIGWRELDNLIEKKKNVKSEINTYKSFNVEDKIKINKIKIQEEATKPPDQYTDSTLLLAMENVGKTIDDKELREAIKGSGLGTPATRAAIIERLIKMKYIKRVRKRIMPLEKGINLIKIVPEKLSSAELTSEWELKLQNINTSEDSRNLSAVFLYEIKKLTSNLLEKPLKINSNIKFESSYADLHKINKKEKIIDCPVCKYGAILENSKAFYCSNWQRNCKYTIWKDCFVKQGGPVITRELLKMLDKSNELKGSTGILSYKNSIINFIKNKS